MTNKHGKTASRDYCIESFSEGGESPQVKA